MKTAQSQALDTALYETLDKYSKPPYSQDYGYGQISFALSALFNGNHYMGFTNQNNARSNLSMSLTTEEAKDVIINRFIEKIINQQFAARTPNENVLSNSVIDTYNSYGKEGTITAFKHLLYNQSFAAFKDTSSAFGLPPLHQAFTRDQILNIIIDETTLDLVQNREQYSETKAIETTVNQNLGNDIQNFNLYPQAFNLCKQDILDGKYFEHQSRDYVVDNELFATIDIGYRRKNQEDAVLILKHPQNPNFKMLAVADGMGGLNNGEHASNLTAQTMLNWFENLNPAYYSSKYTNNLQQYFNQTIASANKKIYDMFQGSAGATFVGAVVNEEDTIISSVGDSRAYVYSGGELTQVTEDESLVQCLFKANDIAQKDDMRFHRRSNVITRHLGQNPTSSVYDYIEPQTKLIKNRDYDTLLLFSDGVTDCLSDEQIKAITKFTPRGMLAKTLVENAKNTTSYLREELYSNPSYSPTIPGGKDNTTAAVYDKRSDYER